MFQDRGSGDFGFVETNLFRRYIFAIEREVGGGGGGGGGEMS